MSLRDVAMNNFERDQAKGSGDLESIGVADDFGYICLDKGKES